MKARAAFEAELFSHAGFVILPGVVHPTFVAECKSLIEVIKERDWTYGNQTRHKWREYGRPRLLPLSRALDSALLGAACPGRIVRQFQWVNLFEQGQFVERHKDAGGDAHLLIPIEVPSRADGGQFWLEHKRSVLPVGVGDALLVRADAILHGTTAITSVGGRRITFNTRLWFSPDDGK